MPEAAAGIAVDIDREACMGSGMCVVYAPGTFTHDGQAKAVLKDEPHDPIDVIRTAVEACPMGALALEDK